MKKQNHLSMLNTKVLLLSEIIYADNFFTRLRGLIGRNLNPSQGLLISPCNQVHTHFMSFSIDVVFMNSSFEVLHIEREMKPWRFSKLVKRSRYVLELPAHAADSISAGDQLFNLSS